MLRNGDRNQGFCWDVYVLYVESVNTPRYDWALVDQILLPCGILHSPKEDARDAWWE